MKKMPIFPSLGIIIPVFLVYACTPAVRYARPEHMTISAIDSRYAYPDYTLSNTDNCLSDNKLTRPEDAKIIAAINKYLGIPYKWGGEDRTGMDCSGFTRTVFRDAAGLELPHNARQQYKFGDQIGKNDLQVGDLVFFKINRITISHVGIYIGDGKFAHASSTVGVTATELADEYYTRAYRGARRLF